MIELAEITGTPYLQWHDADLAYGIGSDHQANRASVLETATAVRKMLDDAGKGCGWFTGNLFTNPAFHGGAAMAANFDVYRFAAASATTVVDGANILGAKDIVYWPGRDGWDHVFRRIGQDVTAQTQFLRMFVEHMRAKGFAGKLLVEPKPNEPKEHISVRDVQTLYALAQSAGLTAQDIGGNIEEGHCEMGGEPFWLQLALAAHWGLLHGVDLNDQYPYAPARDTDHIACGLRPLAKLVSAALVILQTGQPIAGVWNHDAKLRRGSTDHNDLPGALVAAQDTLALAFLVAGEILKDGGAEQIIGQSYTGWDSNLAVRALSGEATFEELAAGVGNVIVPASSQEERLESLLLFALGRVLANL